MLYVILLLILSVLLFGSSAVIGFLGYVLGFIAAASALLWASIAFELDPITVATVAIVGFFALCGIVMITAKAIEPWEIERSRRKLHAQTKTGKH